MNLYETLATIRINIMDIENRSTREQLHDELDTLCGYLRQSTKPFTKEEEAFIKKIMEDIEIKIKNVSNNFFNEIY